VTVRIAPADIVTFWGEAGPDKWFEQDESLDQAIRLRFLLTYEAAANRELAAWEESVEGTLVLLLLLDQFPRNMFVATRAPSRQMRWRVLSLIARWCAASIKQQTQRCGRFSICPSCIRKC
jgi:uncharacterized protein (DUF924 family)